MTDDLPRHHLGMRHLRQIVAGVSDGVILIGTDQTIQWANKPALDMHGVTELDALGGDVAEYRRRFELRYRNRHRLAEGTYPMERVLAGEAFDEVVVEVAPAGAIEPQWTHRIRSLVLLDEQGVPDCLVLILDDETERYHAEERFERAFNANPAPALIVRLEDLRHMRVNRGFLEMTGYDENKVVGRSIYEVDVLEGAARRELAIERLKEGRTIPQMEAMLQLPNGGEKCVMVAGQPIEVGVTRCMLFTFADLDDRRQAETALKQSEERFAVAFRLTPVPTFLALRHERKVLLINDAFTEETGYLVADIVGRAAVDLPLWSDAKADGEIERLLRKDGRARNLELRLKTKTGDVLACLVSAEAVTIRQQNCMLVAAQNVSNYDRTHVEVAGAIEAVMRDTAWFTDAVMEKLARQADDGPDAATHAFSELGELPPRAREILTLVCQGLEDPAIAAKLSLSANTVRNHVASLFRKTGVRTRARLIVWGRERGVTGRRIARGSPQS
ncbi:PAS domain S-box protein [Lichenihabitans sp. Uapishka_5]|uniref:PAS domain S-box protein n=1 Tax=Lichenihabitans sp. Uapishka_5 TaxID=3037302 RepID=UPI0029E7D715|nr:PAS domain S-box protein [Lichenihabitans sp. Uapishka_5]MDX7951226.1 PAS domain S-box protein [Lichenihabitans sp. Uapishka_5]